MALRGHPHVAARTRLRIQTAARQMNYTPNAFAASLAHMRAGKLGRYKATIAFYDVHHRFQDWRNVLKLRLSHEGARARAQQLGYKLERFWAYEPNITGERMSDILLNRGINGVLLYGSPGWQSPVKAWPLRWQSFSAVMMGFDTNHTLFPASTWDAYEGALLAVKNLVALGHHDIGLAVDSHHERGKDFRYEAGVTFGLRAYGLRRRIPPFDRAPMMIETQGESDFSNLRKPFLRWYAKYRPTAILITDPVFHRWLTEAGVAIPGEVSVVDLEGSKQDNPIGGVSIEPATIGANAIDLIVAGLTHNELGTTEFPNNVVVRPQWYPGKTVGPPARPANTR